MDKQIEEMKNNARIYIGAIVEKLRIDGCELWEIDGIVSDILNYITIPEDSVVISKEEYDNLKLEIQQAHNKGVQAGFDMTKYKENSIEQARKETAREILSEVKERMFSYFDCVNEKTAKCNYKGETLMNYEVADMIDSIIENLVEKYGVEIKE